MRNVIIVELVGNENGFCVKLIRLDDWEVGMFYFYRYCYYYGMYIGYFKVGVNIF